jgi:Lectin C-type domain
MKRNFLLQMHCWFVLSVLLIGTQSGRAQNWIQWSSAVGGNNHYYALTSSATNWTAAQKMARSWGGTLATITSSNEQDFINNTFLTGAFEHRPLWIGLYDPPNTGMFSGRLGPVHVQIGSGHKVSFQWVTGEPFAYSNWKPGEPSNSPPGENYVAINWEYSASPPRGLKGDWNDTPLNGTTGYGSQTDGPYFGLVERETDPSQPLPMGITKPAIYLGLMALVAILIICLARFRRGKRTAA